MRDKSESGSEIEISRAAPMGVILQKWYTEHEFITDKGVPLDLAFDGTTNSFTELVKKYGGDIPPGAMRTELKRIKAVAETEDGLLRVLKRNVSGKEIPERLIDGLSWIVYPSILALANNTKEENKDDTWVMRVAHTARLRASDIPRLRRVSADRLAEFVNSIDDMFAAYGTIHDEDSAEVSDKSIGVGVFYFEEDKAESTYFYKT